MNLRHNGHSEAEDCTSQENNLIYKVRWKGLRVFKAHAHSR
jgi:hypothetical protein